MNFFLKSTTCMAACLALSSCGTLTGIPAHGGGKRFIEEQRTVSASIRGALKEIDISALSGKRVALIFSLISDEGSGNISGGRATLTGLLSTATMVSPTLARSNTVELYQLLSGGTSQATTTSANTGANTSQLIVVGGNTNTSTQATAGNTTATSTSSSTNPGGTTTTTTAVPATTTTSATTTGATTTNQTVNNPASTTTTTTVAPSVTSTGNSTITTTNPTVTVTSSGTNNSTNTTNGTSASNSTTNQNGVTTGTQQTPVVTGFSEQTKGRDKRAQVSLQYKGLGNYNVLSVPKSDASLLMSLTRNYFLLNGSTVTTPTDPTAEIVVYVTVDIFGINRQRTDLVIYNNESLKAETAIEMFAADRTGRIIMRPTVGNTQTFYKEEYIGWVGPFKTKRGVTKGDGLLQDFTDQ